MTIYGAANGSKRRRVINGVQRSRRESMNFDDFKEECDAEYVPMQMYTDMVNSFRTEIRGLRHGLEVVENYLRTMPAP